MNPENAYAFAEAVKNVLAASTRSTLLNETSSIAQVNALMDTVIEKNIFFTASGALVKKSGASITQKDVTKIDVA